MDLVNRDGGVHNGGLDGLLLNDWLDVLVYVMVDVLAGNSWVGRSRVLSISD